MHHDDNRPRVLHHPLHAPAGARSPLTTEPNQPELAQTIVNDTFVAWHALVGNLLVLHLLPLAGSTYQVARDYR